MKKAKVDAIIQRKVAEAEERGRRVGYNQGFSAGTREEREKVTLPLEPAEGAVMLGGKPEHMYVQVALFNDREGVSLKLDNAASQHRLSTRRPSIARFRFTQKCWATDGVS